MKKNMIFTGIFVTCLIASRAFCIPNVTKAQVAAELSKLKSSELLQMVLDTEFSPMYSATQEIVNTPKKCTSQVQVLRPIQFEAVLGTGVKTTLEGDFAVVFTRDQNVIPCPYRDFGKEAKDYYIYGGTHQFLHIYAEDNTPKMIYSLTAKCLLGDCE